MNDYRPTTREEYGTCDYCGRQIRRPINWTHWRAVWTGQPEGIYCDATADGGYHVPQAPATITPEA